jgi:16S rRNA (uracil1498-N3)-methyltransferase
MSERFFLEDLAVGTRRVLAGDEARHLAGVMRARVGDEAILFDGSGAEYVGRVALVRKGAVSLDIIERREISRELPIVLTLAVALPRGQRQKWLVEKATELGVTRLIPLITERGVAVASDQAAARLTRQVIEASKQCGRNRLMEIDQPQEAATLFSAPSIDAVRLLADPTGRPIGDVQRGSSEWMIAVGPEGGLTPAELDAARIAGWQFVSLGPRILRVETAAIAMAAWAAIGIP